MVERTHIDQFRQPESMPGPSSIDLKVISVRVRFWNILRPWGQLFSGMTSLPIFELNLNPISAVHPNWVQTTVQTRFQASLHSCFFRRREIERLEFSPGGARHEHRISRSVSRPQNDGEGQKKGVCSCRRALGFSHKRDDFFLPSPPSADSAQHFVTSWSDYR